MKNKIELLAPAGNRDAAIAAISNGADAIYLGLSSFSARAYAANFNYDNLKEIVNYAHLRMVNVYVTMNTILYENEIEEALTAVDEIAEIGVDAVIVQDLALVSYINTYYPSLEVHISTQVGIDDLEGIVTMESIGAKRVVLAREVNLEKIKHIKEFSNMPLEVFGHGALCVSYSGNCLMSGLIGMRSGNRGRCVGACRKLYSLCDVTNNHPFEKTYLLSTKDLKTIDRLDDLLPYVSSLKIEGRMKSPFYVATVVNAYRRALDALYNGTLTQNLVQTLNSELDKASHREYTTGFYYHEEESRQYYNDSKAVEEYKFIAVVKQVLDGKIVVEQRNRFVVGDCLETRNFPPKTLLSGRFPTKRATPFRWQTGYSKF